MRAQIAKLCILKEHLLAAAATSTITSTFAVNLANKATQERLDALQKDAFKTDNFFNFTLKKRPTTENGEQQEKEDDDDEDG
jgi:hypothetical protein